MARNDIGYDFEDFGMDANDLYRKYGDAGHPIYNSTTHTAYKAMPTRDVKLGYWEWVAREIRKDDNAMPSNAPEPSADTFKEQLTEQQVNDTELVPVESIDQFAGYIASWHANVIAKLEHLLEIPDGQSVVLQLGNRPSEEIELTGAALAGFRAGVLTAKLQFDSLPFAVTVDDALDPPVAGEPDADAPKH